MARRVSRVGRGQLVHVRRLTLGYMMPLVLWGYLLLGNAIEITEGRERWILWVIWPALFAIISIGVRPIVQASIEATARYRGCGIEELEPTGARGLVGLTDREPWLVTWSVLAAWISLPTTVAMFVTVLLLRGAPPREASDLANLWMGVITTAGFLVAFLLAPVVRALAGERPAASAPRRPAPEDQQA